MFEAKITVLMPDLILATDKLAQLLRGSVAPAVQPTAYTPAPLATAPTAPQPVATPVPAPVAQMAPQPVTAPAQAPVQTAPTPAPATVAPPTAAAPQYTITAISNAGAALAQAGKMPQLLALLQQFNVQALTQLAPEQYGAVATALRGLGAQI